MVAARKSNWTLWIELIAAASVLLGLIFVALEVRQNNEHARADSVRDLFQMWSDIYEFEYEHSISLLARKSVEQPDDLTEEEYLRLSNYLDLVMNAYLTQAIMEQQSGLVVGDIVADVPVAARMYFPSRASRVWLRDNDDYLKSYAPLFHAALVAEIEKLPVATEIPHLESYRRSY
jgi:hypothetical protein